MRITIITVGSRGDAQPYVALGLGLERAGHRVTIATHETFRPFVTGHGLAFAHLSGDPREVLLLAASEQWLASGRRRDLLVAGRAFLRSLPSVLDTMLADYERVAAGSDLLIYSAVAAPAASAAEQLGIPAVAALLQPLHPTRAFPSIALPHSPRLGGGFNLATHHVASWLAARPTRRAIDAWRQRTLGLPPLAGHQPSWWSGPTGTTTIYGYSPHIVPRPRDWGEGIHVTGYWVLEPDRSWRPGPALEAFLAAGPPPVYVGFGSMTPHHAQRLTAIVLGALRRAGQRGVLVRGWGGLGDGGERAVPLPETVFAIDDVPHEWLFPRMAAVVHHGGSGTTGAALRAGAPSIVIPLGFDQPYWAARVAALGVGPRGVHRRDVTAEWLGDAILRAIGDSAMRERAAVLGARLRAERGVDVAVELVTRAGSAPGRGGRADSP
jgi:sterol 3beta-glucosyltransferase